MLSETGVSSITGRERRTGGKNGDLEMVDLEYDLEEPDDSNDELEEADALQDYAVLALETLKQATPAKNEQNGEARLREVTAVHEGRELSMDNVQTSLIPILAKHCIDNLANGAGIPDAFESGLNAARKKYGAVGEDVFIQYLNRQLADRQSNFRVRPGAIPAEHANDQNYRVYTLTDAGNGNIADTAAFAIGRFEQNAARPEAVRPIVVTIDNVHKTNIPSLVGKFVDRLHNGAGIPDAFETGLNEAIKTYGAGAEAVFIQLINNKLASGNSQYRMRPGAIPAEHANDPTFRVYTLTHVGTGAFADTAAFPLNR